MAAYFDAQTLEGFAHWMKVQAKEEMGHAMKFYEHIKDRLGRVSVDAIDAPPAEWKSPLAAFEAVYAHECKVTALIDRLLALAVKEKDTAAAAFLQWFVTEQVEEEAQADAIVQKLKMIGSASSGADRPGRHAGQARGLTGTCKSVPDARAIGGPAPAFGRAGATSAGPGGHGHGGHCRSRSRRSAGCRTTWWRTPRSAPGPASAAATPGSTRARTAASTASSPRTWGRRWPGR